VKAREVNIAAELPTNDLEERIKALVDTLRKTPIAWERLMADADLCKALSIETKFDKVLVFEVNASSTPQLRLLFVSYFGTEIDV
jgi:hypothetical protein